MVTLQEIIDFSEIERGQVEAISELEHIPEVVAAELAHELIRTPRGVFRLHNLFREAIERAEYGCSRERVRRLERLYKDFSRRFPQPRVL
ncbi:MAG: hypothetical protein E6Q99_04825 [Elusimicrobia bacterium]|jgi:hypothetical protein|nr:hypothetical protein [Dechloromonas sp.]TXH26286.1 MAG: hypothetical protein E6Q99_04825 [Elusimicrobiota bacterium]